MKKAMVKIAAALLLTASVFSNSGAPAMETASAPATTAVSTETATVPVQADHDIVLTAPAAPETVLFRADSLTKKQKAEMATVASIAAVGGLKATVQEDESACIVFLFDRSLNHGNPYDVTWDYGEAYNAYLDIVDWSLVFDSAYYKSLFPVLAMQYHNDDALLLKHFQTVGIHEGRQGCEGFNVAAYKANCSKSLRKAFGDNYECYYLYYLLHQDTESKVKTTGTYPQQLTQKLTIVQATELKWVNKYRAEVGADPLSFDGELAALAAYRAYMDCTEGWDAHDGLQNLLDNDKFYPIMPPVRLLSQLTKPLRDHGRPRVSLHRLRQPLCLQSGLQLVRQVRLQPHHPGHLRGHRLHPFLPVLTILCPRRSPVRAAYCRNPVSLDILSRTPVSSVERDTGSIHWKYHKTACAVSNPAHSFRRS